MRGTRNSPRDGLEIRALDSDDACAPGGAAPTQRPGFPLLTPEELEHRREQDDSYWVALPVLEEFGEQLAYAQSVLAFFDASGCMLFLGGDPQTTARLAEISFCPGASWGEELGGERRQAATSGRSAVETCASEHLVAAGQSWFHSAAPVVAPRSGEVLGSVDVTGPKNANRAQCVVAARAIARVVDERLRSIRLVLEQAVEDAFRSVPASADLLFAVDGRGGVLAVNEPARRRLSIHGREIPLPVREALGAALRPRTGALAGELVVDWPGLTDKVTLLMSVVRYEGSAVGAVVQVRPALSAGPRARARTPSVASARYDFQQILGQSEAVLQAIALARVASRNELPVVLLGESGTGKEMFAQAIHSASTRADGPFIAVNCGCIPAALLEAELFGYEAGTFTGGRRQGNAGKFEEASGGTVFLDEVSELSPQAQTALLRVLQEREVVRLGGSSPRPVDIRIIAASNKSLADEIRAGRFRADLFFRLHVLSILVPPLRARLSDVRPLAHTFLREAEGEVGCAALALSDAALHALEEHDWPGNVRELRNVILRAAATASGPVIEVEDLPEEVRRPPGPPVPSPSSVPSSAPPRSEPLDREALVRALNASSWNIARTAEALGVSRMTLYRWLHKHDIERV